MAKKIKRTDKELEASGREDGRKDRREKIDLFESLEHIQELAEYNARAKLNTVYQLQLFLMSWWSRKYNRPLKDPLLASYTLEELLYEFHDHMERSSAADEKLEGEGDRIEEDINKAALDWAEQEELKELGELQTKAAKQEEKDDKKPHKPTKEDVEWMKKKMDEAKEIYGESFGEDIDEDFNE